MSFYSTEMFCMCNIRWSGQILEVAKRGGDTWYDFILEISRIWTAGTFLINVRHAAIVRGITSYLLISFNSVSDAVGAVVQYI